MTKIEFVKTKSKPRCPYCGKELENIEYTEKELLQSPNVFLCPFCKKVLGLAGII